jgi:hypothetical protein
VIKGFSYGPLRFEAERAKITIGKLKCEPLPYEPSTTPDPMKTGMIEEQQIAINSLIDRVNKLEQHGKYNSFLLCNEKRLFVKTNMGPFDKMNLILFLHPTA